MQNDILFSEKQRFTQWWLWLILFAVNSIFVYGCYQQIILVQEFGDKPMSNAGILVALSVVALITFLFYSLKLETIIKVDGIYVRFFPFHIAYKKFTWNNIEKVYVRQYKPITEYGGWGLRYGVFGNGNALNVSGNQGLQIIFNNSTTMLLIGTKKPEELQAVIEKIVSKKY
jgi:hypothetical protein